MHVFLYINIHKPTQISNAKKRKQLFCGIHKLPHHIDLRHRPCMQQNCSRRAVFATPFSRYIYIHTYTHK